MGHQIIKQPDGNFCVWSTHVDSIILFDASAEDLIEYYAKRACENTRQETRAIIEKVNAGYARAVYYRSTMTYAEALSRSRSTNKVEEV